MLTDYQDIGDFKSIVAANAAMEINPYVKVNPLNKKVRIFNPGEF